MNEIDDIWAADLVELQEWKNVNNGYRYILNAIDCFSKYAWSVPLKDENVETVLDVFSNILLKHPTGSLCIFKLTKEKNSITKT